MASRNQSAARIAVRWRPIESLTPDPGNARVHPPGQVARIADSIAAFGFNVPILVDERGGVLAGHGRLLAARRLRLTQVPTIALDHLSKAQRRAFMIADNRLSELAAWDDGRLRVELGQLKSLDLDFSLSATGFDLKEIDLRIGAGRVDAVDRESGDKRPSGRSVAREETGVLPDALRNRVGRDRQSRLLARTSRQPTIARAGDEWTLGRHRLLCRDAADPASFTAIDVAIRRWQAVTGEDARLRSGGERFDDVARARAAAILARTERRGRQTATPAKNSHDN